MHWRLGRILVCRIAADQRCENVGDNRPVAGIELVGAGGLGVAPLQNRVATGEDVVQERNLLGVAEIEIGDPTVLVLRLVELEHAVVEAAGSAVGIVEAADLHPCGERPAAGGPAGRRTWDECGAAKLSTGQIVAIVIDGIACAQLAAQPVGSSKCSACGIFLQRQDIRNTVVVDITEVIGLLVFG